MKYVVEWKIDLWADSALEAAKEALQIQRDPTSQAVFFEVVDCEGRRTEIDLLEFMRENSCKYVRLKPKQSLPCMDEDGYDLSLEQIRIVKQMWREGWRLVEMNGGGGK